MTAALFPRVRGSGTVGPGVHGDVRPGAVLLQRFRELGGVGDADGVAEVDEQVDAGWSGVRQGPFGQGVGRAPAVGPSTGPRAPIATWVTPGASARTSSDTAGVGVVRLPQSAVGSVPQRCDRSGAARSAARTAG